MKNFLRILYLLFFIVAGIWVFMHPIKTETNLLRAVFSNTTSDELVVKLSGRYSSKINVLVESENPENTTETATNFLKSVDKNSFDIKDFDFNKILETYKSYNQNLLSAHTAKLLETKEYDQAEEEAYSRLYDPFGIMLLPLNEDPFLLFPDYVKSLGNSNLDTIEYNDKYYKILQLGIKDEIALSPELANKQIKNLIDLQTKFTNNDTKVYLTGAPVHSYYASSRSIIEINVICVLSLLFIAGLCYFYFRNLKIILPIAVGLGLGIFAGYLTSAIIFPSIHVLTFVFSTTLIGICIDYSLHYFIEKDLSKILKSLTVSMLTTVSAFGILLFSGIELLKQISVFTMTGLFTVYLMVVLFYPLLKIETENKTINFSFPEKLLKPYIVIIILISSVGLFLVKFDDDVRNMYVPSKKLAAAEKLFSNVTGGDKKPVFAVVNGNNFQQILTKEEEIAKNLEPENYQSISKFIPSINKQKENFRLRQNLYTNKLKNFATFLTPKEQQKLLNKKGLEKFVQYEDLPIFKEFLLDDKTSIMVLYDVKDPQIITSKGANYVNVSQDVSEKIGHCRKSCLQMLAPVFALLLISLSFIYHPITTLKIITPSVIASIFAIGLVSLTGQHINLFHILAIFLIIGFGLDYSVFRASGIKSSSDAVLLSCMTSIFSFILLAMTSFKLISSLGFILSAGLSVSYLTSLLFSYNEEEKPL